MTNPNPSTSPWPIILAALLSALTTGGVTIGWQASGSQPPAVPASVESWLGRLGNEIGALNQRVSELERRVTDLERPPRSVVPPQHPGRIGSSQTD